MDKKSKQFVRNILKQVLAEDVGVGDVTSESLFKKNVMVNAQIIVKEKATFSGGFVVRELASLVDKKIRVTQKQKEGTDLKKGTIVCVLRGPVRSILKMERISLNFLGILSGVATITHEFVSAASNKSVQVLDTRKTTPLMRLFERAAVRAGGGVNHRFGLFDQVLIKDNHIAADKKYGKQRSLVALVCAAKKHVKKNIKIEVEVDTLLQLAQVLPARPDIILLDNMNVLRLKKAVALVKEYCKKNRVRRPQLEASGGITLHSIKKIGRTGIDRISIGALTHSASHINFSLEIM